MGHKIKIDKRRLFRLYHRQGLSPYKMAKIFDCSFSTITNRLKDHHIPLKTKSQAQMTYYKYNFGGNLIEKAYMLGFRIGDLNVYKTNPLAETIIVRCNTTSEHQIRLIKNLFDKYGHVTICNSKDDKKNINCHLNTSFNFLIPKTDVVDGWIRKNNRYGAAFAAGYLDAEATFIVSQGRGRFKVDSYDKNVLQWLHKWLTKNGIDNIIAVIGKKGQWRTDGTLFNSDLWRVSVNRADALLKFINRIKPDMKHKKRIMDANKVLSNIAKRKINGTIR